MAKYNSTTFGSISGRHGSAVASTGKRGNILSVFTAPSNPRTEKQVAQRTKFAYTISSMASMREMFEYLFRDSGGYNQAVSQIIKSAVTGTSPDFSIDYSKVEVTAGSTSVSIAGNIEAIADANRKVKTSWFFANSNANYSSARNDDRLNLVYYNEDAQEAFLFETETQRAAGTHEAELPESWEGNRVHCWMYFSREGKSLNSKSRYINMLQL